MPILVCDGDFSLLDRLSTDFELREVTRLIKHEFSVTRIKAKVVLLGRFKADLWFFLRSGVEHRVDRIENQLNIAAVTLYCFFKVSDFSGKFFVAGSKFSKFNEGSGNLNVYFNSFRASQYA